MNKVNTQAERDAVRKKAQVNLLRRIKLNEMQRQSVENKFEDAILYDKKPKPNVFGSYVDQLVVKNFIIENLQSRLKLSKDTVVSFVSKLNNDELYILSQYLQDFIKFILETNGNSGINDFILKTNFTTYKLNVDRQGKKLEDEQIIVSAKKDETDTLQEAGLREPQGAAEEDDDSITLNTSYKNLYDDISQITDDVSSRYNEGNPITFGKLFDILTKINKDKHKDKMLFYDELIKKLHPKYNFLSMPPTVTVKRKGKDVLTVKGDDAVRQIYDEVSKHMKDEGMSSKERNAFTEEFMVDYMTYVNSKYPPREKRKPPPPAKAVTEYFPSTTGKGIAKEYIKLGRYYIQPHRLNTDKVLQVRSGTGTQVYGMNSIHLNNKTKQVIDKVLYQKPITYDDIQGLDDDDKDQLYSIANKMKVTELMNIPSKIKSRNEKLMDEYKLLKGEVIGGNDNIDLIKRLKVILLRLKDAKLINIHEFNNTLRVFYEYGL